MDVMRFIIFFLLRYVSYMRIEIREQGKKNTGSKDNRVFHGKLPLRLHAAPRKNIVKFCHAKAT